MSATPSITTRRAKYGNTKVTVDGIEFDSKAEACRYGDLKLLVRAGEITDLDLQPKFDLFGQGHTKICSYRADFGYTVVKTRLRVIEDVKGMKTPAYRLKAKLFLDNFGVPITEVKA